MKRFIAPLLLSLSFGAFAADATSLRTGVTRGELEKSIGTKLIEDKTSVYKNAFTPKEFPESLRSKLPAAFSALDFKYATFYFNDSGKLWRVQFQADVTAVEAFKVYVDTTKALDDDTKLKPIPETSDGIKIGKISPAAACADETGEVFKLNKTTGKALRAKWTAYSQAERLAFSMSCGERGYISNEYLTKEYLWNRVSFESEGFLSQANINSVLAQPVRASIVFSLIQTSKDQPGIEETEATMKKEPQ